MGRKRIHLKKVVSREVEWPSEISILTPDLLCQGMSEDEQGRRDLLSWLDEDFAKHGQARKEVEKAIARKLGLYTHNLITWSDNATKKEVIAVYSEVMKGFGYDV
jgi:hypothetical protein